jgi:hypothetical protein
MLSMKNLTGLIDAITGLVVALAILLAVYLGMK